MRYALLRGQFAVTAVAAALLASSPGAQQRDTTVAPAGTGQIAGVVMSAETTPQPMRRALVTIAGDLKESRSVITDDAGRFVFGGLPAGQFRVDARKQAYLKTEYGVTKPGRTGSPIALAAGENRQISLTLHRGGVITGALRDVAGAPVAGVSVAAFDMRVLAAQPIPPDPETVTTDDRGVYRFYGLPPSEYVIAAAPQPSGSGEIGARSSAEIDALFARLNDRQRSSAPGPGQTDLPAAPSSVGYSPTYYPGTPMFGEASRIRVAAGEEKTAMNFTVTQVRVASIHGTVSAETPNLAAVILAIIPDSPRFGGIPGTLGITSVPPNAKGEFQYGNFPPGRYRIIARARKGPPDPNAPPPPAPAAAGLRGGPPPPGVKVEAVGDMLYGVADIDVRGEDLNGVFIPLQLGGYMSGKLVFDTAKNPLPDDFASFRVGVQQLRGGGISQQGSTRVGAAISAIPPVNVNDDGTFLVTGIGPSTYFVTCQIPAALSKVWKLQSAMYEGKDLLDTNIEGPFVQYRNVVVTLSDKRSEIAGSLQSASGQPVSEYYVVAFSTDRTNWRQGSRRNASVRPATNGRFAIADLPAGEYFLAALTDLDPLEWQEPAFLEQVAAAAIKLKIADGEKIVQGLRIR